MKQRRKKEAFSLVSFHDSEPSWRVYRDDLEKMLGRRLKDIDKYPEAKDVNLTKKNKHSQAKTEKFKLEETDKYSNTKIEEVNLDKTLT